MPTWKDLRLEDLDVMPAPIRGFQGGRVRPGDRAQFIEDSWDPVAAERERAQGYPVGGQYAGLTPRQEAMLSYPQENAHKPMYWGRPLGEGIMHGLSFGEFRDPVTKLALMAQHGPEKGLAMFNKSKNPVMPVSSRATAPAPVTIVNDTPQVIQRPPGYVYPGDPFLEAQARADSAPEFDYTDVDSYPAMAREYSKPGFVDTYNEPAPHTQMHGASIVDMSDLNPSDVIDMTDLSNEINSIGDKRTEWEKALWANEQDRGYEDRKLEEDIYHKELIVKNLSKTSEPDSPRFQTAVMLLNNAIKQRELVNAHYGEREKVLAALNADRYGAEQRANAEIAAASMKGGQSGPSPEDIADALIKSGVPPQVAASNATVMAGLESAAVAKMFEDLVSRHNKEMDPSDIASLANALTAAYNPAMGQRSDEEVMAFNRMRGTLGGYASSQMMGGGDFEKKMLSLAEAIATKRAAQSRGR